MYVLLLARIPTSDCTRECDKTQFMNWFVIIGHWPMTWKPSSIWWADYFWGLANKVQRVDKGIWDKKRSLGLWDAIKFKGARNSHRWRNSPPSVQPLAHLWFTVAERIRVDPIWELIRHWIYGWKLLGYDVNARNKIALIHSFRKSFFIGNPERRWVTFWLRVPKRQSWIPLLFLYSIFYRWIALRC